MANRVSAQVILKTIDNVSANFVTNTFYFNLDVDSGGAFPQRTDLTDDVSAGLVAMYKDMQGVLGGLAQNGHRIKFVDLDEPTPRYPYQETTFDFDTDGVNRAQLPNEVCIVSSFEAAQTAGLNQASRRGRSFVGPISLSAVDTGGRVTDVIRGIVADAYKDFADKQDTAGLSGWTWTVYSRKLDTMSQVVMGHVDNAFDTQRRRGIGSSVRSVWDSQP